MLVFSQTATSTANQASFLAGVGAGGTTTCLGNPDPTPRELPTTELLLVEGTPGYVLVNGTGMRYVGKFLDNYKVCRYA